MPVIDSRAAEGGGAVRRRRQCGACRERFTTLECLGEEDRGPTRAALDALTTALKSSGVL
jgi:hypothetical protein